jgi:hypothetical protein
VEQRREAEVPMMGLVVILLMGLMFMSMFGFILFLIVKGMARWSDNNSQPVRSERARILARRTSTSGGNHVSTSYYLTFELPTGERREFAVGGSEYGMLVQHDTGLLTYQGTRYKGFQRDRA